MRYRKLKRELLESIFMRQNALKTATKSLGKLKWPCRRMSDDAKDLMEGFGYCCKAYDEFNDKSLSQISWHVE